MEIKELQELFGVGYSSVYYILAQQGFHEARKGYRRGKIPEATRKQIMQEYKDGALVTDLSNKYNVTTQAIYHHLDRNGLRIRKEKLLKQDAVVAQDSIHKDFVPPLHEPQMIKEKKQEHKFWPDPQKAHEHLITPGRDLKEDLKHPFLMAIPHTPTHLDKHVYGTQVLALNERQLYVQVNHDRENPVWISINPEKKGLLTRIKAFLS